MELIELSDSVQQIVLEGRLDTVAVGALETRFTAIVSGGSKDVLVDLTNAAFCGSLAIRMFLSNARVLQRRGRRLVLAGAQPQVQEVFETVALGAIIPIFASVQDGRAELGA
ncbi:STAS domain-containing protein [Paracraurococcus ruber]|nr:STAS domain-containing protein [Paracraurococcus ruber]